MLSLILSRGLLVAGALSIASLPLLLFDAWRQEPSAAIAAFLPLCFYLAGALAVWKRPEHRAARRLLAVGALHLIAIAASASTPILPSDTEVLWLLNLTSWICFTLGFAAIIGLYAVFPDGVYHRRYERVIVRLFTLAAIGLPIVSFVADPAPSTVFGTDVSVQETVVPFTVPALRPLANLVPIVFVAPVIGVILLILRYRRAPEVQRAQMRWPLTSAVVLGIALAATPIVARSLGETFQAITFMVAAGSLPATLVIGMLRHRLFDIDVIIRKSLVYGVLWLAIAAVYAVLAALPGVVVGQRFSLGLAVVVTIAAAMLFQPARRRLERLADRLVFGDRLGGYELVRQFGAVLEHAFDLEELVPQTAATVHRGLAANWVRVSLHDLGVEGPHVRSAVTDGIDGDDPGQAHLTVPLVHAGERVGVVECGPKREGDYTEIDRNLLATLARQATLAIRNARLATSLADRVADLDAQARELAASRTRIVQAAEAERRRIERDIHDGVQQQIVALMAALALARTQLGIDPAQADATLSSLEDLVRQTHVDVRELARGIHPAVLSDRGLEEAVEARLARLPIGVTIESDPSIRDVCLAQEVEGAAYFFISEGLTNVMKHATTDEATVRLHTSEGQLHVEVADEGRGYEPGAAAPSGLSGLKDRLEALGGSLEVVTRPGEGTRLIGHLPVRERQRV